MTLSRRIAKRGTLFSKAVSLFVAVTFIISSVAFAAPADNPAPQTANTSQEDIISSPEKVVVPRDYGLVKMHHKGREQRLIVHIQDAHCNYEAQGNIMKILENLIRNYGLNLVSVEGAEGLIDTSWFKSFPDEDVRKEVATYFMKKGEITGPEFLSITSDYNFKLYGAETKDYYIENLNAFTASYQYKHETEKYYSDIRDVIKRIKSYAYTDELKEFDSKQADYESKKVAFNDYIRYLQALCEKHKINIRGYGDFFKLISTLIYEKKIDFTIVDKERNSLIDALTKKLSKEAVQDLVMKSLTFKVGKINAAEYYTYLRKLSVDSGIDFLTLYPNLSNYVIYTSVYSKIENEQLFKEISLVERAIKENMFKNDEQRQLDRVSHNVNTILNLINIKLLNADYDYYMAHKDEFTIQALTDFLKKESAKYGFAYSMEPPSEAIQKAIPKLEEFYSVAIKRDKAIVENTLKAMEKNNTQLAVLVTGGFHTEGMSRLFDKEGISYLVVSPNITKDVPTPYIQILTNQRTPFEGLLVGTAEAKETSVAPYMRTSAISDYFRNPAELRRTSDSLLVAARAVPLQIMAKQVVDDSSRLYALGWGRNYFASAAYVPTGEFKRDPANVGLVYRNSLAGVPANYRQKMLEVVPVVEAMARSQALRGGNFAVQAAGRNSISGEMSPEDMETALRDTSEAGLAMYGTAALEVIDRMRHESASVDEVNVFIKNTYTRKANWLYNLQEVLTGDDYPGYDVIVVSNTTPEEAEHQQKILEQAFKKRTTDNPYMNREVCILSIHDTSVRGQTPGQINTMMIANKKFKEWAERRGLPITDLDELRRQGLVKIATYHNGGKGERGIPATISSGNSRGDQPIGFVYNKAGERVPMNLVLAVVLNSATAALSNNNDRDDVWWVNQLAAGTNDFRNLKRSNYLLDKFVIGIPVKPSDSEEATGKYGKDLFDYGSALREGDRVRFFLANKRLTKKDETGRYQVNPAYAAEYEALTGGEGLFDYGSFSMSHDLYFALLDYWTNVQRIQEDLSKKRDIDPAFIQIIVPFAMGLHGKDLPGFPTPEELDAAKKGEERNRILDELYQNLIPLMDESSVAALDKVYSDPDTDKRQMLYETLEMMVRYREIFGDLSRVVGYIDLGPGSHWLAYKRLLDMANNRFVMLTDITGHTMELETSGEIRETPATDENKLFAEDTRIMTSLITEDAICTFTVRNPETGKAEVVKLTKKQVQEGVTIHGVYVKDSIIYGECELFAGSRIVNSVVSNSQGLIDAENSYVEEATIIRLNVRNSVVYRIADARPLVRANKEIVADAFRPAISEERDPTFGGEQARLGGPVGFEPNAVNNATRLEGNAYSFQEIIAMPCNRSKNDEIEQGKRIKALIAGVMSGDATLRAAAQQALDNYLTRVAMDGTLTARNADIGLPRASASVCNAILDAQQKKLLDQSLRTGTSGVRGTVEAMTDLEVYINVKGFLKYLEEIGELTPNTRQPVAIGRDLRPSSPRIRLAVIKAIEDSGYVAVDTGEIPSPGVLLYAMEKKMPSAMITGSHVPDDMNGIKFCLTLGEVMKSDEAGMAKYAAYDRATGEPTGTVRREWFEILFPPSHTVDSPVMILGQGSLFGFDGMFKEIPIVRPVDVAKEAQTLYLQRYRELYRGKPLAGKNIVIWQQSAVGRDVVAMTLGALGATTVVEDRETVFVPVDTENVSEDTRARIREYIAKNRPDAVVTLDGDSDRPALFDEKGNFLTGDKLGLLTVKALIHMKADIKIVAVPVTTNPKVVEELRAMGIQVIKTKVGSPWVIQPLEDAKEYFAADAGRLGWEVNGGFILVGDIYVNGQILKALPSRDAILPITAVLTYMADEGLTLSELIARDIPEYFVSQGLTDPFPRETGQALIARFAPDPNVCEVEFQGDKVLATENYLDVFGKVLEFNEDGIVKINTREYAIGDEAVAKFVEVREMLSGYCQEAGITSPIRSIIFQDGVIITFENGTQILLRSSGNADQFRAFGWARTEEEALDLQRKALNIMLPAMKRDYDAEHEAAAGEGRGSISGTVVDSGATAGRILDATSDDDATGVMTEDINNFLERMRRDTSVGGYLPGFLNDVLGITRKLQDERPEVYRALQVISGQALNILWWNELNDAARAHGRQAVVPGAESIRLTNNPEVMVKSPDNPGRGPSFVDNTTMPVKVRGTDQPLQAEAEGKPGPYNRGNEVLAKIIANVEPRYYTSESMAYEINKLAESAVIYLMIHGFIEVPEAILDMTERGEISTLHETLFPTGLVPESIQNLSTAPGHFQGKMLDVKHVTQGRFLQLSTFYYYDAKTRELKCAVIAQLLEPGSWAISWPGSVDYMINIGGTSRFNDFSIDLGKESPALLEAMRTALYNIVGQQVSLEQPEAVKEAARVVPYNAITSQGATTLVRNGNLPAELTPALIWMTVPPATFDNAPSAIELYKSLTEGRMATLQGSILNTIQGTSWISERAGLPAANPAGIGQAMRLTPYAVGQSSGTIEETEAMARQILAEMASGREGLENAFNLIGQISGYYTRGGISDAAKAKIRLLDYTLEALMGEFEFPEEQREAVTGLISGTAEWARRNIRSEVESGKVQVTVASNQEMTYLRTHLPKQIDYGYIMIEAIRHGFDLNIQRVVGSSVVTSRRVEDRFDENGFWERYVAIPTVLQMPATSELSLRTLANFSAQLEKFAENEANKPFDRFRAYMILFALNGNAQSLNEEGAIVSASAVQTTFRRDARKAEEYLARAFEMQSLAVKEARDRYLREQLPIILGPKISAESARLGITPAEYVERMLAPKNLSEYVMTAAIPEGTSVAIGTRVEGASSIGGDHVENALQRGTNVVNWGMEVRNEETGQVYALPVTTSVRVIDRPVVRMKVLTHGYEGLTEITELPEIFDINVDRRFSILKADLVASGIIPETFEGNPEITLAAILEQFAGKGKGIEITEHVKGVPGQSGLGKSSAIASNLLLSLAILSGQTEGTSGALTDQDKMLAVARTLHVEQLTGALGGWQDNMGMRPGVNMYTTQPGQLIPSAERLNPAVEGELPEAIKVLRGGLERADVSGAAWQFTGYMACRFEDVGAAKRDSRSIAQEEAQLIREGRLAELPPLVERDTKNRLVAAPAAYNEYYRRIKAEMAQTLGNESVIGPCGSSYGSGNIAPLKAGATVPEGTKRPELAGRPVAEVFNDVYAEATSKVQEEMRANPQYSGYHFSGAKPGVVDYKVTQRGVEAEIGPGRESISGTRPLDVKTLAEMEEAVFNPLRGMYLSMLGYLAGESGDLDDSRIIVAVDPSVKEGPNSSSRGEALNLTRNMLEELARARKGAVILVEGRTLEELETAIRRAIAQSDKPVRKVVFLKDAVNTRLLNIKPLMDSLENEVTPRKDEDGKMRPVVLLDIDLSQLRENWTLTKGYKNIAIVRALYGVAINVGFGRLRAAAEMYSLVDAQRRSVASIYNMLADRIIKLIPMIVELTSQIPEAARAARKALESL